jgi:hypothetical protein
MILGKFAVAFLLAQLPLPQLRTEPTGGGSIFYIKNVTPQPLTAYLIELVDYPGSSYAMYQDHAAEPLAAGAEKRIQVANMTVGAVPDYVKMQAAVYADGTTAGAPEKVAQIVERRRATLGTTRELIRRIAAGEKSAEIKQWSDSLPAPTRANRNSQAAINYTASRSLISETLATLQTKSPDETLTALRASERALAASKPTL